MKKLDRLFKEWFGAFAIALVIVIMLWWVIWPTQVDGHSMEPTLADGDFILISKLWSRIKPLEVGDLVVVNILDGGKKQKIVKRIIGLEGDHVVIKEGKVSINAHVLEEPYLSSETYGNVDIYVPRNAYFILGDNRKISKDSRLIGCVYKKDIRGQVLLKKSY